MFVITTSSLGQENASSGEGTYENPSNTLSASWTLALTTGLPADLPTDAEKKEGADEEFYTIRKIDHCG